MNESSIGDVVAKIFARALAKQDEILADCIQVHGDAAAGARLRDLLGIEEEAVAPEYGEGESGNPLDRLVEILSEMGIGENELDPEALAAGFRYCSSPIGWLDPTLSKSTHDAMAKGEEFITAAGPEKAPERPPHLNGPVDLLDQVDGEEWCEMAKRYMDHLEAELAAAKERARQAEAKVSNLRSNASHFRSECQKLQREIAILRKAAEGTCPKADLDVARAQRNILARYLGDLDDEEKMSTTLAEVQDRIDENEDRVMRIVEKVREGDRDE